MRSMAWATSRFISAGESSKFLSGGGVMTRLYSGFLYPGQIRYDSPNGSDPARMPYVVNEQAF